MNDPEPLDLDQLKFEPLATRPSKVALTDLGRPMSPGATLEEWINGLPNQLAGKSFPRLRDAIVTARSTGNPVVAALGGHVIKTGCGSYLIDWIERGILNGLALNGSAAIHDSELAMAGHTSEDVGARLIGGEFGFACETSQLFVRACSRAKRDSIGLGKALGIEVELTGGPGVEASVLVAAHRKEIPLTVHVAIGTDIVHMTGELNGAELGEACVHDFRKLTNVISTMSNGVWLNLGSAVVLPEVFLKAVSIVRNLGKPLDNLTTANLDFNQQYRGLLNVLQRPGAEGIALTGHHEIMIPLLHAAVVNKLGWEHIIPAPHVRPRPVSNS